MVKVDDVLDRLADRLHVVDQTALQPFWPGLAGQGLALAQSELYSVLAARGMTTAAIDGWTGADPWVLQRALYHAMMAGAGVEEVDLEAIKQADAVSGLKVLGGLTLTDATGAVIKGSAVGKGTISGGWDDAKAREPTPGRLGFIDPSTGRLRGW